MSEDPTRFHVRYSDSPKAGRLALVTLDNGADYRKPTTFDDAALGDLERALDEIEKQDARGVLFTGKPFIFAVGADLDRFAGADAAFARRAGRRGHQAFGRVRALSIPTLAAINGACMGGGLELALHCQRRTLAKSAAPIAFPEVFLSILPAWGGTQLAPRVIGPARALEVIVHNALNQNRTLRASEAFARGLADWLVEPVDFLERSLQILEALAAGEAPAPDPRPDEATSRESLDEALERARAFAEARVHGATRAPTLAIDLIEFASRDGDLAEGLEREEEALAELLPARQAQASVYAFHLVQQRVRRQPWRPEAPARPVQKVAVVGAGLMGAQLGALFLQRLEVPLVMKDIADDVLKRARGHIEAALDERVARGRMREGKASFLKSLVTYTTDDAPLAGADFAIEAVLERLDVKRAVFAALEKRVSAECLFATNTSSLSVSAMAEGLEHPERVVGFHFFNPVKVLPLVEVARGTRTDDATLSTALELAKRIGKSAVPCRDATAFVVNRLLMRFMGVCIEAADAGTEFRDVDAATLALGLPMGPFPLLSLVGPRIAHHTAQTLHEAFPERFPESANLARLAESGLPGVYDEKGQTADAVRALWEIRKPAQPVEAEALRQWALRAVAEEARLLLDDGVVADARDIDTCMILGAGWPFFNGGICKHLDQIGMSEQLFGAPLVGARDAAEAAPAR
ncbi:MAG: 3-hydroxyacyl-CoA dehydrogenase NAD-binding domain-containing protein [Myxococcales bacterium]|nr:3-hydroxyacyl-CoA dehydrogenase NAD-binding domain-containing protein [Myxococcales bacterium]